MSPIIGITPLWDLEKESLWMLSAYTDAIRQSGGLPVILPFDIDDRQAAQLADRCDGFLFTGGQDVAPSVYGETEALPLVTCPKRDLLEDKILRKSLSLDKPVFGICRGLQFINAALGGTLWQDLPSQRPDGLVHRQGKPYDRPSHSVQLTGPLAGLFGKNELMVNTLHHQAVRNLAPGMETMALAPDGIIEAFHSTLHRFLWAVQWHPEYLYATDPDSQKLFARFIQECYHETL